MKALLLFLLGFFQRYLWEIKGRTSAFGALPASLAPLDRPDSVGGGGRSGDLCFFLATRHIQSNSPPHSSVSCVKTGPVSSAMALLSLAHTWQKVGAL